METTDYPDYTDLYFFLFVFSHLHIFSTSYLPSFRVSSCNLVANFLVIFMVNGGQINYYQREISISSGLFRFLLVFG